MRPVHGMLALVAAITCLLVLDVIAIVTPASETDPAAPPASMSEAQRAVYPDATEAIDKRSAPALVVIGVTGVTWDSLGDLEEYPTLAAHARHGSVANLVTRTQSPFTCPQDAWLSLQMGHRVSDLAARHNGHCPTTGAPTSDNLEAPAASRPGLLGDALAAFNIDAAAIGPGAALALTTSSGTVATSIERPVSDTDLADLVARQAATTPVTIVDLGEATPAASLPASDALHDSPEELLGSLTANPRATAPGATDIARRIETVLAALDPSTQVIVASLAPGTAQSALQAVLIDTADVGTGFARSASTRQNGLIHIPDLTQQILDSSGIKAIPDLPGATIDTARGGIGSSWPLTRTQAESARAKTDLAARLDVLSDRALHASVAANSVPTGVGILGIIALTCGIILVFLVVKGRLGSLPHPRLAFLRSLAVAACALPLATYIVNRVPTWRLAGETSVNALAAQVALSCLLAGAIAALAHVLDRVTARLSPAWAPWAGIAAIAATTSITLANASAAATLPRDALLGFSTILGQRFYGIGTSQFAVLCVTTLTAVALTAGLAHRAGHAITATLLPGAFAFWIVTIDASPTKGADFAGSVALLPAALVLLLLALTKRFRAGDLGWVGLLTALLLIHVGLRDYARPQGMRSLPGQVVDLVLHGGATGALTRRLSAITDTLTRSFVTSVSTVVGIVLAIAVVWAGRRFLRHMRATSSEEISCAFRSIPSGQALLVALILSCLINAVFSRAGVLVLGIAALIAFPLALALALSGAQVARGLTPPPLSLPWIGRVRAVCALVLVAIGLTTIVVTVSGPTPLADRKNGTATTTTHGPVVLALTHSLTWDRLLYDAPPTLTRALRDGLVFNLAPVRTSAGTCPLDAAAAISAGTRVSPTSLGGHDLCASLTATNGDLPLWPYLTEANRSDQAHPLGGFGKALSDAGASAAGIGALSGYVLASPDGRPVGTIDAAAPTTEGFADQVAQAVSTHDLVVVDAEALPVNAHPRRVSGAISRTRAEARAEAEEKGLDPAEVLPEEITSVTPALSPIEGAQDKPVAEAYARDPEAFPVVNAATERTVQTASRLASDHTEATLERLDAVLAHLPDNARVLIATTTQASMARTMGVGVVTGHGVVGGLGRSGSVRQPGMAQMTDIAPTILSWLDTDSRDYRPAGSPIEADDSSAPLIDRYDKLVADAAKSTLIQRTRGAFHGPLTQRATMLFLLAALIASSPIQRLLRHRFPSLIGPSRTLARLACLTLACAPLGVFVISLTPWWRTSVPLATLGTYPWIVAAALSFLLLAAAGPTRPYLPAIAVAAMTCLLLTLDIATGSTVLLDSPLGFSSLMGARYYGAGNEAYTLLATGFFFSAGLVGANLGRRGHRLAGVALAGGVGLAVGAIDGWPTLGADFGGPISLLPGLFVLVLLTLGIRVSWKKATAGILVTGIVGTGIAVADWLRPATERTHLGRFIDSSLNGELWGILHRKLSANLSALTWSGHRWVVLAALVCVLLIVVPALTRKRETAVSTGRVSRRLRQWVEAGWGWLTPRTHVASLSYALPGLTIALVSWATTEFFAFALNDSGILLPGLAAILGIPLTLDLIIAHRVHTGRTS